MMEETWESTAINVGGENLMELWGGAVTICEESTESFWQKCSTTFPLNKFLTNSGEIEFLSGTEVPQQFHSKFRETERECACVDKMMNEHVHSNPQGGRDLFTHQKIKFHSQLLHAQLPPPPQRNRYPKSNGLNPTSGIFP
jgi:hypothetical protein